MQVLPAAEPSADDVYEIYQLIYSRAPERRVHANFMLRDMHDGPMPMDFSIWIVRNQHRTVLFDTGYGQRAAHQFHLPLDLDPVEALERIGVDPDAIEDIVISHMHVDHAGNIGRFGKARFHVQDGEVSFATGRCMCDAHTRRALDVEDVTALIRHTFADRVVFHDGDDALFPGLSLHVFPGHSAAVQALRVNTRRGPVVLASDVFHYWANLIGMKPFYLTIDAKATLQSYRRIMALGGSVDRIIPGHDPKVRRLFPAMTVAGVELLQLHAEPCAYDPADLARTDDC